MSRTSKAALSILVVIISLTSTGCLIGTKQVNNLTMHDPIPLPESAKGVVRIATNDPIPLVVDGVPDESFEKDVGGDVVVKPGWYAALVDCWNEHHAAKVNQVRDQ